MKSNLETTNKKRYSFQFSTFYTLQEKWLQAHRQTRIQRDWHFFSNIDHGNGFCGVLSWQLSGILVIENELSLWSELCYLVSRTWGERSWDVRAG